MQMVFILIAAFVAVAAAIRGTWSPCGLSMLSSITPVAERARGHRYGATAAWFIAGAIVGGATLGAVAAGAALLLEMLNPRDELLLSIAALSALLAAWVDAGVFGVRPPFLHRQVNETWLRGFRSWVYGGGFGWQIGAGVTTYIMTTAVLLTALLAALSMSPITAMGLCILFGATRGAAVLLSAKADTTAAVASLHRRLEQLDAPMRHALIATQAIAASALAAITWGLLAGLVALLVAAAPIELTSRIAARHRTA